MRMPRRAPGFTLVESLIAVAIVAIAATLALPSFARLLGATAMRSALSDLEFSLNHARNAAVSRATHVVACPTVDFRLCLHGPQWHLGWMVFADPDRDGALGAGDTLLASHQGRAQGVGIVSSSGRVRVDYYPDGTSPGTNLTLTVCDRAEGPAGARTVVVSNSGRVRHGAATPAAASDGLAAAG
jgi:type IV fimbrial biogenesis protein FimT